MDQEAKQKFDDFVQKTAAEIRRIEATGEAGGGMVKIKVDYRNVIKDIEIDTKFTEDDKKLVEDLIVCASNAAAVKIEQQLHDHAEQSGQQYAELVKSN